MKNNETSCRLLSLRQVASFLKKNDNYIILTHTSPDGDTLGSAFALYYALNEIGKTACVICADVIPQKYDYFARKTDHINRDKATVIAVDVATASLLGDLQGDFGDIVDLCIDHHISNTKYAKNLYLDATAAATAEIIYDLLNKMKVNINDVTAKAIYTGIVTDTGCFKYSSVTEKTHIIASELYQYNIDAPKINRLMFDTKSKKLLQLEKMVLDKAEFHFDDKCFLLSVTAQMQEETGCSGSDLEGIAVISRSVEGVKVGITIKQTDDTVFKVSLRTFEPIDASEICKKLGGGGHISAAAATIEGTFEEVKAKVLDAVKIALEENYDGNDTSR